MQHYFLIILLGLISFLSPAQDSLRMLFSQQMTINGFRQDSAVMESILDSRNKQLADANEQLRTAQKIINKQRVQVCIFAGAAAGALVGSAIPAVGTVVGAAAGALAGSAVYGYNKVRDLFKRKKR